MIDEILTMMRSGSSEESIRRHIELAIRLAESDARIAGYKQGMEAARIIFNREVRK